MEAQAFCTQDQQRKGGQLGPEPHSVPPFGTKPPPEMASGGLTRHSFRRQLRQTGPNHAEHRLALLRGRP
jgi:hypothetical protein